MSENKKVTIILGILIVAVLGTAGFTGKEETLQADKITEAGVVETVGTVCAMRGVDIECRNAVFNMAKIIDTALIEEKQEAEAEAEQSAAEKTMAISQDMQSLLASIIYCEAGNQPYEGQVAVGAVVVNRVQNEAFPNTIEEVIYQSGQFVPAMTGWLDQIRNSAGYTDSAMQAATDALAGVNPVGDCLYFDQGGSGIQIGAHYFH